MKPARSEPQSISDPKPPIAAAGGVVYRWKAPGQLEILLIRKQHGFWSLPKGRIKRGESERDAAAREVAEETGLSGEVEALIHRVRYTVRKKGRVRPKQVAYYLVRAGPGTPRPGTAEGIRVVRWFPIRAALRRIRRARLRTVVRAARALLEGAQEPSRTASNLDPVE